MRTHLLTQIAFVLILTFGISVQVYSQVHLGDTLTLSPKPVGGDIFPHIPHKSPANDALPICIIDGSTLSFLGTGKVSLSYYIVNAYNENVHSGLLALSSNQKVSVDISELPIGTYYLILAIAGREYEGEFVVN